MKVPVYNLAGDKTGEVTLPASVFGLAWNADLVHQVLRAHTANERQVVAHTKDRSEVRGGGVKPWRQKGTGRARHGSTRSPIWTGGGVTFGPTKERSFKQKINKKMNRKALLTVLSRKAKDGDVIAVEDFNIESGKTKEFAAVFEKLPLKKSTLLLTPVREEMLNRAAKNVPNVTVLSARNINVPLLLSAANLVLMKKSVKVLETVFAPTPHAARREDVKEKTT